MARAVLTPGHHLTTTDMHHHPARNRYGVSTHRPHKEHPMATATTTRRTTKKTAAKKTPAAKSPAPAPSTHTTARHLRIPDDMWDSAQEAAKDDGYTGVSELVRALLRDYVAGKRMA